MDNPPEVDARTAYEQMQRGEVCMLDVREPEEWELGHIEGAESIPMSQLGVRWREIDATKRWVCVCLSGSRSDYASALLRQAGIAIANMEGGMLSWQANSLPISPPGIVATH
ncbi:MAG TPA: rhodanese-like domain-containing protein [Chloroflexia bacterium]|nr:rhodanese-like domain-containing protein [Chloroflexia bacterium]